MSTMYGLMFYENAHQRERQGERLGVQDDREVDQGVE